MKTKKIILTVYLLLCFIISFGQKGVIINQGSQLIQNDGAYIIIGDDLGLINNSAESIFNGSIIFSGTSLQEIGGSESSIFNTLEIDNINGVFLNNHLRITEELLLTSGVLDLTDYNLTLNDNTAISGTFSSTNMINVDGNGRLIKEISYNDLIFLPVGDLTAGADYSPIEFDFLSGNYSNAYFSVGIKNEKHPDNFSTNDYLNRYWALGSGGITNLSCEMTFYYVPGDIVGNEANIYGAIRENSSWHNLGQASSNQFTGTNDIIDVVTGVQSDLVGIPETYKKEINITYQNGHILIRTHNGFKINSAYVFDITGKLIDDLDIRNTGFEEIPFSPVTGYYLIEINTDKGNFSKKIFVN